MDRRSKLERLFSADSDELKCTDIAFNVTDVVTGERRTFRSLRALCELLSPEIARRIKQLEFDKRTDCTLPITGCTVTAFQWLLQYFYGLHDSDSVLDDDVANVLQCAEHLDVKEVFDECMQFLYETHAYNADITLSIVMEMHKLKLQRIPQVQAFFDTIAVDSRYIAPMLPLLKAENLEQFPDCMIRAVVASGKLPIDESLFLKLAQWAKHHSDEGDSVRESPNQRRQEEDNGESKIKEEEEDADISGKNNAAAVHSSKDDSIPSEIRNAAAMLSQMNAESQSMQSEANATFSVSHSSAASSVRTSASGCKRAPALEQSSKSETSAMRSTPESMDLGAIETSHSPVADGTVDAKMCDTKTEDSVVDLNSTAPQSEDVSSSLMQSEEEDDADISAMEQSALGSVLVGEQTSSVRLVPKKEDRVMDTALERIIPVLESSSSSAAMPQLPFFDLKFPLSGRKRVLSATQSEDIINNVALSGNEDDTKIKEEEENGDETRMPSKKRLKANGTVVGDLPETDESLAVASVTHEEELEDATMSSSEDPNTASSARRRSSRVRKRRKEEAESSRSVASLRSTTERMDTEMDENADDEHLSHLSAASSARAPVSGRKRVHSEPQSEDVSSSVALSGSEDDETKVNDEEDAVESRIPSKRRLVANGTVVSELTETKVDESLAASAVASCQSGDEEVKVLGFSKQRTPSPYFAFAQYTANQFNPQWNYSLAPPPLVESRMQQLAPPPAFYGMPQSRATHMPAPPQYAMQQSPQYAMQQSPDTQMSVMPPLYGYAMQQSPETVANMCFPFSMPRFGSSDNYGPLLL